MTQNRTDISSALTRQSRIRAARTVDHVLNCGTHDYKRTRDLPGLVPLDPAEFASATPQATARIVELLQRGLRMERARMKSGHWSYDLNRHLALLQALRAEQGICRPEKSPHGRAIAQKKRRPTELDDVFKHFGKSRED